MLTRPAVVVVCTWEQARLQQPQCSRSLAGFSTPASHVDTALLANPLHCCLILHHTPCCWVSCRCVLLPVPQGPVKRAGAMFTIGVVGRCLSKALVQGQRLTAKCRELVLIAAPKDSRVYLQYPESASALVQKVAELQRAAGRDAWRRLLV